MIEHFDKLLEWEAPVEWLEIKTIEAHTGGEPLRVIIDGYPSLPGTTILEKRRNAKENFDFNFEISQNDMDYVRTLDMGGSITWEYGDPLEVQ